ncbi:hypothetical protein GCM10010327_55650 [Streptomyces nitrosporeus]|nr:hypothetical protein GCM10010327_55650 [Streptomyces nitrosporeus]
MTAVNVPAARLSVTPSRAVTAPSPAPYALLTDTSRRASAARRLGALRRSGMTVTFRSPASVHTRRAPSRRRTRRYGEPQAGTRGVRTGPRGGAGYTAGVPGSRGRLTCGAFTGGTLVVGAFTGGVLTGGVFTGGTLVVEAFTGGVLTGGVFTGWLPRGKIRLGVYGRAEERCNSTWRPTS